MTHSTALLEHMQLVKTFVKHIGVRRGARPCHHVFDAPFRSRPGIYKHVTPYDGEDGQAQRPDVDDSVEVVLIGGLNFVYSGECIETRTPSSGVLGGRTTGARTGQEPNGYSRASLDVETREMGGPRRRISGYFRRAGDAV